MPAAFDHRTACDLVEAEVARFARVAGAAAAGAGPDLAVPTCGDWRLADLVLHVGQIHRWVAAMVTARASERMPKPGDAPPPDPAGWHAWLGEGNDRLMAALRPADPDAPMWSWGPDQHVRWWVRRMLHETTVHRADVELAAPARPAIDAAVAADGLGEFLGNLPSKRDLAGSGERIVLAATDLPGSAWVITRGAGGMSWSLDGPDAADVRAEGPVADLYLGIWGRYDLTGHAGPRFGVSGDVGVLAAWRRVATI
jgi:uncharacterized protein (TIGR03083 family)